jgi:hypothetical protein
MSYVVVGKTITVDEEESEVVCQIRRRNKKVVCDSPQILATPTKNIVFRVVSATFAK